MTFTSPRTFWISILAALALGFGWPAPGLALESRLTSILMVMMFLSCLRIDLRELRAVPREWRRYALLLLCIFLIPTGVVFLTQRWFDSVVYVGLALAAASPSAISVVFLSDLFRGQPSRALTTTIMAHLISPILTPALVWLVARQHVQVDTVAIMTLILKLVLLPLLAAQVVRVLWPPIATRLHTRPLNGLLLVLLIWGIIAPTRDLVLDNLPQFLLIFGVVAVILGLEFLAGVWLGHDRAEDTTWVITDSYKNFTLSAVLALSLFGPTAVIGSVAFTIAGNLLLIPLPWLVQRFQRPGTSGLPTSSPVP